MARILGCLRKRHRPKRKSHSRRQIRLFAKLSYWTSYINHRGVLLDSSELRGRCGCSEKKYGKETATQRAHVNDLLNLAPVFSDKDTTRLRKLYDSCSAHFRGLRALGEDETTFAAVVVPAVLQKMPEAFRLTITRGADFLNWTMEELLSAFFFFLIWKITTLFTLLTLLTKLTLPTLLTYITYNTITCTATTTHNTILSWHLLRTKTILRMHPIYTSRLKTHGCTNPWRLRG